MDRCEQLAFEAEYAAAVLSNGTDLALVALDGDSLSDGERSDLQDKGFYFIGACGVVGGETRIALDAPLAVDPAALSRAYLEFIQDRIHDALKPRVSVDWLTRLCALDDPREN